MKKMNASNFIALNLGWLVLVLIGLVVVVYALTKLQKPVPPVVTTQSANFATDPVVSTPVMANNPYVDIFRDAASAAINDGVNPWIYLQDNWSKAQEMGVEQALLDFIVNQAHQQIPDSSMIALSIRDYSDPNSIVMEYRDPATDSIMVTTGHDPEPALYATFFNKKDSTTFKLICANGLVRELGGYVFGYNQDYIIKPGDSFIAITGSTPIQAYEFGLKNSLPVRVILHNRVYSKTPNVTRKRVFADYKKINGIFDVVLQPGDILRKQDGKWLYVCNN